MNHTTCVMPRHHDRPADAAHGTLLCQPCRSHLRNRLDALPHLADWLRLNITKASGGGLDPVSGSREQPVPVRLDVLSVIQPAARFTARSYDPATGAWWGDQVRIPNIHAVTAGWARIVCEECVDHPESDHQPADTTPALTAFLGSHLGWVVEQPWVDEMAAEVGDLYDFAWKLVPRYRKRMALRYDHRGNSLACPRCDLMCLALVDAELPRPGRRRPLERHVECEAAAGGCGQMWIEGEYDWLARLLTGTEGAA